MNWLAEGVKPHIGLVRDISLYHTIFLSLWDTTPGDNLVLIFYLHIHVFIKVRKSNRFSLCKTSIGVVSGKTPQGLSPSNLEIVGLRWLTRNIEDLTSPKDILLHAVLLYFQVPFGDVENVSQWMRICEPVESPSKMLAKKPIKGFDCTRKEVSPSHQGLIGWIQKPFSRSWHFSHCDLIRIHSQSENKHFKLLQALKTPD